MNVQVHVVYSRVVPFTLRTCFVTGILDAMVSHILVPKRKRPALNAAKEDFHYKLGHMEVNREANREANLA